MFGYVLVFLEYTENFKREKITDKLKEWKTDREVDEHNESFSFREGYVKAMNDAINLVERSKGNEKATSKEKLNIPCVSKRYLIEVHTASNNILHTAIIYEKKQAEHVFKQVEVDFKGYNVTMITIPNAY